MNKFPAKMMDVVAPITLWIAMLIFVIPVYGIFALIFSVYRLFVTTILYLSQLNVEFAEPLSSRDLTFISDDYYGPDARKIVISCIQLKGRLEVSSLRNIFLSRILKSSNFVRVSCVPYCFMGYWFWKRVAVELSSKIQEWEEELSEKELRPLLLKWVSQGFEKDTPLWSITVVHSRDNRTILVVKLHHMAGDGVSFMKFLEHLCDPGWTNLTTQPVKSFSFLHWVFAWVNFPWSVLKAFRLAKIRKGFRPNTSSGEGHFSWTGLDLEKLRVIRRHKKCIFPSLLTGIIAGAMNRLKVQCGKSTIADIARIVIPTPWPDRSKDSLLTNHVAWLHSEVKLGDEKSIEKFEQDLKDNYASGLHGIIWQVFKGLYLLPAPCLYPYCRWANRNLPPFVLTSIPGSMTPLTIGDVGVEFSYPVLSLGCSTGVNIAATTYHEKAYVFVRVSKEMIPNAELMNKLVSQYIHEELEKLYSEALGKKKESNFEVKIM